MSPAGAPAAASAYDSAFRQGWSFLEKERYEEARETLAKIPPGKYDLGDYVVYFQGVAAARGGDLAESTEIARGLAEEFPGSPLLPYMQHEIAYAAALDNDLSAARAALGASLGKVSGNGRKAEEGYISALLIEDVGATAAAAERHLENFSAYGAQEAANLSAERLWKWRQEGKLAEMDLPVGFYARFARAAARAGETEWARAVYEEAMTRFPPGDDYYAMVLDFAEFHRKQGEVAAAASLLSKLRVEASPAIRSEVRFLRARVDWKAGRLDDARREFQDIADGETRSGTADRARYYAAWIAENEGDLQSAADLFRRLRRSQEDGIRRESLFRYPYALYRLKRYEEAAATFDSEAGGAFGTVESARQRFWKARALRDAGKNKEAEKIFADLSADAFAGPYALFAARELGRDPFRFLNAPSSGETKACGEERDRLWSRIRRARWGPEDREKVRRAERLTLLGVIEYAVLEAERVDRAAARKAIGMADGGAAGLFRYLAGDLKGGIRATSGIPLDASLPGLVDRIRYPLAPEFLADCDRKRSGLDPMLLHAVIRQESRFQADVLSSAGAVGLMQLMPRTAADTARREKLHKPRKRDLVRPALNVRLGAAYLSMLVKRCGGDYFRAVAAYNSGEVAVSRWWDGADGDPAAFLEEIAYKETRFYLRRVFLNLLQYYRIYRPEMFVRYFPTAPREARQAPDALPLPEPPAPGDNVLSPPPMPGGVPTDAPPPPAPAGK